MENYENKGEMAEKTTAGKHRSICKSSQNNQSAVCTFLIGETGPGAAGQQVRERPDTKPRLVSFTVFTSRAAQNPIVASSRTPVLVSVYVQKQITHRLRPLMRLIQAYIHVYICWFFCHLVKKKTEYKQLIKLHKFSTTVPAGLGRCCLRWEYDMRLHFSCLFFFLWNYYHTCWSDCRDGNRESVL